MNTCGMMYDHKKSSKFKTTHLNEFKKQKTKREREWKKKCICISYWILLADSSRYGRQKRHIFFAHKSVNDVAHVPLLPSAGCSMQECVCIGARCVHIFSTSLSNKLIKFCFYHILSTPAVCSANARASSFSPSQLPTNVQMPVILLIATDKTIEKNSRKWTNGCRICKIKCLTLIFKSLDEIKWCDQIHSWSTSTLTFTYLFAIHVVEQAYLYGAQICALCRTQTQRVAANAKRKTKIC